MISDPLLRPLAVAFSSIHLLPFSSARRTRHERAARPRLAPVLLLPLPETSCSSAPRPGRRVDPEGEVEPVGDGARSPLRGGRSGGCVGSWCRGGGSGSGGASPSVAAHSVLEVLFKEGLLRGHLRLTVQIRVRTDAGDRYWGLVGAPV